MAKLCVCDRLDWEDPLAQPPPVGEVSWSGLAEPPQPLHRTTVCLATVSVLGAQFCSAPEGGCASGERELFSHLTTTPWGRGSRKLHFPTHCIPEQKDLETPGEGSWQQWGGRACSQVLSVTRQGPSTVSYQAPSEVKTQVVTVVLYQDTR